MLRLLIHGIALYGVLVLAIYLLQGRLVFPRTFVQFDDLSSIRANEEVIHTTTPDNTKLEGLLSKPQNTRGNILMAFAGNAYDVADLVRFLKVIYPNFYIMGFNYRGYGGSDGSPTEKNLLTDSLHTFDQVTEKFPNKDISVFGLSIGTAVASYLTANRNVKSLILVTPFDSLKKVAKSRYPFLPVNLLLRHNFETDLFIQNIKTPIAVISAENDEVIPKNRTMMLKKLIPNMVYNKEISGAYHNDILTKPNIDKYLHQAMKAVSNHIYNPLQN